MDSINNNPSPNNNISPKTITKITKHFEIKYLHDKNITCLTSLSKNRMATGSKYSLCICLIDLQSKLSIKLSENNFIHDDYIYSLSEIIEKDQLISCSLDTTIKLWDISNSYSITLLGTFYGHKYYVWQAIYLGNNRIVSCSYYDGTIKFWDCLVFQHETSFKQTEDYPRTLLHLHNQNKLFISYSDSNGTNGYVNVYNSLPPYQLIKSIRKGIYTTWRYGMVQLGNDIVALSKYEPTKIYLIDPNTYEIIQEIVNSECITSRVSLCAYGYNSLICLWEGNVIQIRKDDNIKEYDIVFKGKENEEEMDGYGGVVLLEGGKYLMTNTTNGNNSINVFALD